ncbi:MAG: alkaline phosphatase D family protein [Opitutales bacterium]
MLVPRSVEAYYPTAEDFQKPLEVIAFGSCNDEDKPQDYWPSIAAVEPDVWIWMGDNIYGDSRQAEVIEGKYTRQFEAGPYVRFREAVPIIGTWDDHDFGENDAGSWYPLRATTQQLALDFLEEPAGTVRRQQGGLYTAYRFGPEGRQVQVILLDTRYHMTRPGPEGDLLGEAQWRWLESQLRSEAPEVTILGSSIQFVAEDQGYEKWARFPKSRQRMVDLIARSGRAGVLFISGDRHIHELSCWRAEALPYPLYDLTSSGLTHTWESFPGEPNRWRLAGPNNRRGFGVVRLDWSKEPVLITLEIQSLDGTVVLTHSFERGLLTGGN